MTNAITTAIARECRLSSACYLSFRVMARAAEFSPWLVRWREPRAINTCRPSWTMRGCRVYIQAGFRNFLPVSVTYADQRPPICQTWNVAGPCAPMEMRWEIAILSLFLLLLSIYETPLPRDRRTFSETRRVCRQCGVARSEWTLVYLVEDKLSSGEIWFSFWAVFFFWKCDNVFQMFWIN